MNRRKFFKSAALATTSLMLVSGAVAAAPEKWRIPQGEVRQVALDAETTGIDPAAGHRIIEIAACEILDRRLTGRYFQSYCDPERDSDPGAMAIYRLTRDFLTAQPKFAQIVDGLLQFIAGAPLVIHNADLDVAFLDAELTRMGREPLFTGWRVVDTLSMARAKGLTRPSLQRVSAHYGISVDVNRDLSSVHTVAQVARIYLAMEADKR